MAKSRFLAPCTLLTTSLSKMPRVKPSEPTSLGTRSDARTRCHFGTAEEAKAMLERAVAEVKEDKAKALNMFNKVCANASDGIITAHPYGERGKQLRNTEGMHGVTSVKRLCRMPPREQ